VVLGVVGLALGVRPAVVVARLDVVQLVPGVLAELSGPQALFGIPGQALHIAVAVGVDGGVEGVARRRLAVRGQPEDLAARGVLVLSELRFVPLARAGVEHLVRAEGDPPAVVIRALRDAPEHRVGRAQLLTRRLLRVVQHAHDAVVRRRGEVRIDHAVRGVLR
jgi:hypothetical protein